MIIYNDGKLSVSCGFAVDSISLDVVELLHSMICKDNGRYHVKLEDPQSAIDFLCDGEALQYLGLDDEDAVETLYHAIIEDTDCYPNKRDLELAREKKKHLHHIEAFLTNRVFNGSHHGASEGEAYWAEYVSKAIGDDGKQYECVWHFETIKGYEPSSDAMPWHDLSNIISMKLN